MQAGLHCPLRDLKQAIAKRRAQRDACKLATRLVCERHLGVKPAEARIKWRHAGLRPVFLRHHAWSSLEFVITEFPEMTDKLSDPFGRRSGAARHTTAAASNDDRCETASIDSFPASDAPGWTAVTGSGAPCTTGGGLLHSEEPSS